MTELETILIEHAKRYTLMRPCDAVKLIYQNEFGGGHMIFDKNNAQANCLAEYSGLVQRNDLPLLENIGNGLARMQLAALDYNNITPRDAFERFYESSLEVHGSLSSFKAKLNILCMLTKAGSMPFSNAELDAYLADYTLRGYPMVSHSSEYRAAYSPAYRIVKK